MKKNLAIPTESIIPIVAAATVSAAVASFVTWSYVKSRQPPQPIETRIVDSIVSRQPPEATEKTCVTSCDSRTSNPQQQSVDTPSSIPAQLVGEVEGEEKLEAKLPEPSAQTEGSQSASAPKENKATCDEPSPTKKKKKKKKKKIEEANTVIIDEALVSKASSSAATEMVVPSEKAHAHSEDDIKSSPPGKSTSGTQSPQSDAQENTTSPSTELSNDLLNILKENGTSASPLCSESTLEQGKLEEAKQKHHSTILQKKLVMKPDSAADQPESKSKEVKFELNEALKALKEFKAEKAAKEAKAKEAEKVEKAEKAAKAERELQAAKEKKAEKAAQAERHLQAAKAKAQRELQAAKAKEAEKAAQAEQQLQATKVKEAQKAVQSERDAQAAKAQRDALQAKLEKARKAVKAAQAAKEASAKKAEKAEKAEIAAKAHMDAQEEKLKNAKKAVKEAQARKEAQAEKARKAEQSERDIQAAKAEKAEKAERVAEVHRDASEAKFKKAKKAVQAAQAITEAKEKKAEDAEKAERAAKAHRDSQEAKLRKAKKAAKEAQAKKDAQAAKVRRAEQAERDAQAAKAVQAEKAWRAAQSEQDSQAAKAVQAEKARRAAQSEQDRQAAKAEKARRAAQLERDAQAAKAEKAEKAVRAERDAQKAKVKKADKAAQAEREANEKEVEKVEGETQSAQVAKPTLAVEEVKPAQAAKPFKADKSAKAGESAEAPQVVQAAREPKAAVQNGKAIAPTQYADIVANKEAPAGSSASAHPAQRKSYSSEGKLDDVKKLGVVPSKNVLMGDGMTKQPTIARSRAIESVEAVETPEKANSAEAPKLEADVAKAKATLSAHPQVIVARKESPAGPSSSIHLVQGESSASQRKSDVLQLQMKYAARKDDSTTPPSCSETKEAKVGEKMKEFESLKADLKKEKATLTSQPVTPGSWKEAPAVSSSSVNPMPKKSFSPPCPIKTTSEPKKVFPWPPLSLSTIRASGPGQSSKDSRNVSDKSDSLRNTVQQKKSVTLSQFPKPDSNGYNKSEKQLSSQPATPSSAVQHEDAMSGTSSFKASNPAPCTAIQEGSTSNEKPAGRGEYKLPNKEPLSLPLSRLPRRSSQALFWVVFWDVENVTKPHNMPVWKFVRAIRSFISNVRFERQEAPQLSFPGTILNGRGFHPGASSKNGASVNCTAPQHMSDEGTEDPILRITVVANVIQMPLELRKELHSNGVNIIHVESTGRKEVADKALLTDICLLPNYMPPPLGVAVLSGDVDFSYAVSKLTALGYTTLIISSERSYSASLACAPCLVAPLSEVINMANGMKIHGGAFAKKVEMKLARNRNRGARQIDQRLNRQLKGPVKNCDLGFVSDAELVALERKAALNSVEGQVAPCLEDDESLVPSTGRFRLKRIGHLLFMVLVVTVSLALMITRTIERYTDVTISLQKFSGRL